MDINLILSAQTLCLAPQIKRSVQSNGLIVLKNVPARTYLTVTKEQWQILLRFEKPRMAPSVLGEAIRERQCLPLGEFYELILKALRADILLEPGSEPEPTLAIEWGWQVRPGVLALPLAILFATGLIMALGFHPKVPSSIIAGIVGLVILSASRSVGELLTACMVRGGGGEVYRPRWKWKALPPHLAVDSGDIVMMPTEDQTTIGLAVPAVLAASAGVAAWHYPEWSFLSLLGLVYSLRPIFGGRFAMCIQVGNKRPPSDAEHDYIFPPNRRPAQRLQLLRRALSHPTTWARLLYGVVWTLAILYWGARLTDLPPWSIIFWRNNGIRILVAVTGSLAILGTCYLAWEIFHWTQEHASVRRGRFQLWRKRWFGSRDLQLDEPSRAKVIAASPLLASMHQAERLEIAQAMTARRHGPWRYLPEYGNTPTQVAVIVSGKVGLRTELPTGRTVQVQVMSEGDIIGLHDLADPKFPKYRLQSLTPVTLLSLDRAKAEKLIVSQVTPVALTDNLMKMPFLRRIPLCRNWHVQAINRFARLSSIVDYPEGEIILSEDRTVEEFFIIFQGEAQVMRSKHVVSSIRSGEFFGEIGLMQNSAPNAGVTALHSTRCLRIARVELLRFVTHNSTVALELERVSSARLGRPIFPLRTGDFRVI